MINLFVHRMRATRVISQIAESMEKKQRYHQRISRCQKKKEKKNQKISREIKILMLIDTP